MEKNLTVGDDEKKVVKEGCAEVRKIICEEFEKIQISFVKHHQSNSKESKLIEKVKMATMVEVVLCL